jgi:hypothetical protein
MIYKLELILEKVLQFISDTVEKYHAIVYLILLIVVIIMSVDFIKMLDDRGY